MTVLRKLLLSLATLLLLSIVPVACVNQPQTKADAGCIKDIQFDDKRAKVKLVLEFQLVFPMGAGEDFGQISKDIGEVWLWIDGAWWYTTDDDGTLL